MPNVIVIAGANGAGKSTLAPYLLRDALNVVEYVNADTIAEGLSAFAPENAAISAGRIMLERLNALARSRKNFAFETTLSSRFYARWLAELQNPDYQFHLIYLWLENADLAIERVRTRVKLGGHHRPDETIRRRYERGIKNLFELYLPIADTWQVFNVSGLKPQKIAFGDKISGEKILEEHLWRQIKD